MNRTKWSERMSWLEQFPEKKRRGSWPRCVLFTDGEREEVAERLTELVGLPHIKVSADDKWMPCGKPVKKEDGSWDKTPSDEVQLDKKNCLVSCRTRERLEEWWLATRATTPNWDIASTCRINGKQGLILVEAKAHGAELTKQDDCGSENPENVKQIGKAISEASRSLQARTENKWKLSPEGYYQLSNRFAWSWKLATLKIPVVLVYLGFLNACEMDSPDTKLFCSEPEWQRVLRTYCEGKVDNSCWGKCLCFKGTPFIPVIRTCNLPL